MFRCFMPLLTLFQLYHMAISFISGGNQNTLGKSSDESNKQTFIKECFFKYTLPRTGIETHSIALMS